MAIILPSEAFAALFSYTGAETTFVTGFRALSAANVSATYTPTGGAAAALTQGVHYSVTLAANGDVTVNKIAFPGATPGQLYVFRRTPATQGTDFANLSKYLPDVHTNLHTASAMRDAELLGLYNDRIGQIAVEAAARIAGDAAEATARGNADSAEATARANADAAEITARQSAIAALSLQIADAVQSRALIAAIAGAANPRGYPVAAIADVRLIVPS
jgi:hypothetical protein